MRLALSGRRFLSRGASDDSRARLLNAALAQVDAYGWTERSLVEGAQSIGCVAACLPRRAASNRPRLIADERHPL